MATYLGCKFRITLVVSLAVEAIVLSFYPQMELSSVDLVAHSSLPGLGSPRQKHKFPPYVPGSPALFHQFLGGAMLSKNLRR